MPDDRIQCCSHISCWSRLRTKATPHLLRYPISFYVSECLCQNAKYNKKVNVVPVAQRKIAMHSGSVSNS